MLLMQSLSQRRAGKVVDSGIKYADVRKAKSASSGVGPEWLQKALKTAPVSIGTPSSSELGVQSGIFGALVVWAFATGVMSTPGEASLTGQEIPGTILAIGFGLSIYFLRKQNIKLGELHKPQGIAELAAVCELQLHHVDFESSCNLSLTFHLACKKWDEMAGCARAPHTCPLHLQCVAICDGKE